MRYILFSLLALIGLVACNKSKIKSADEAYVVITSETVQNDAEWMAVADALKGKHSADIVCYKSSPVELIDTLRKLNPRYVAIVEKPEYIGRDYVIEFNLASRKLDEDIYADFMWGIITGYDAKAAMRMIENSTEPLVIKDAVATIMELNSAKWFDNYAWVDDL